MIHIPVPLRRILHLAALLTLAFVMLWPRRCVDAYVPKTVQAKDVIIHFAAFFVVGFLGIFAYGNPLKRRNSLLIAIFLGIMFGLALEGLQELPVISRNCQWKDIFDNTIGVIIGSLVVPLADWPRPKKHS